MQQPNYSKYNRYSSWRTATYKFELYITMLNIAEQLVRLTSSLYMHADCLVLCTADSTKDRRNFSLRNNRREDENKIER
jgi:hypothetical protein